VEEVTPANAGETTAWTGKRLMEKPLLLRGERVLKPPAIG
jgi:hypothetical protein